MKVATITFHWATNYGAVVQAYALQQHLIQQGYQTEIIDYKPVRARLVRALLRVRSKDLSEFRREVKINAFRRKYLNVSRRTYGTSRALMHAGAPYDAFICGSDQIWNEWFTLNADGKQTLSYFLNFVPPEKARVSYGASFGADRLSDRMSALVKPELSKFRRLGVRENTGLQIIADMGMKAKVVVDPTLLLSREAYEGLISFNKPTKAYPFFEYILHDGQGAIQRVGESIFTKSFADLGRDRYKREVIGVLDWLYHLRHAEVVLTNSFHGVAFCLIFHRSFVAMPVEGLGDSMNDRLVTLLESVDLADRIVGTSDEGRVEAVLSKKIDWDSVDASLALVKRESEGFLEEALRPSRGIRNGPGA